jgi:hypothetical protein
MSTNTTPPTLNTPAMSSPAHTFSGEPDEDCNEYIETIEFNARNQLEGVKSLHMRVNFRCGMLGKASAWYRTLGKDIRGNWPLLRKEFYEEYSIKPDSFEKFFFIQQEIFNLKQGEEESEAQYLQRAEKLDSHCPAHMHIEVARRVLGGLRNIELQYRIQFHLLIAKKINEEGLLTGDIAFSDIRNAFTRATNLIGKPKVAQ